MDKQSLESIAEIIFKQMAYAIGYENVIPKWKDLDNEIIRISCIDAAKSVMEYINKMSDNNSSICLRYDLNGAGYPPPLGCGEDRHPQVVLKEIGIMYQKAVPQSMAEQWWFMGCSNVPEVLPPYLTYMTEDQCLPWKIDG